MKTQYLSPECGNIELSLETGLLDSSEAVQMLSTGMASGSDMATPTEFNPF